MAVYSGSFDTLYAAIRAEKHCKQVNTEWDEAKKLLENNIDSDYQSLLRSIVDKVEKHRDYKRERKDAIAIESEDGGSESDPRCEMFLCRLKKHEKSYVLEINNNGITKFIKYEAESSSDDDWEDESQRKMASGVEQVGSLIEQELSQGTNRLLQDQSSVNVQAVSGRKNEVESDCILREKQSRKFMVQDQKWLLFNNPSKRTKLGTENQHKHAGPTRPGKAHKRALVHVDGSNFCQWPGPSNQALPGEGHKVQSEIDVHKLIKGKKIVMVDNGAKRSVVVQLYNEHLYQQHTRKSSKPRNKHLVEARPDKKDGIQANRNSSKVLVKQNLVKRETGAKRTRKAVLHINNECCYQGKKYANGNQALPGEKCKVQRERDLYKLIKRENACMVDVETKRSAVLQLHNEHLSQKHGPKSNRIKNKHSVEARPYKKNEVQPKMSSSKVVIKQKNVVKRETEAKRKRKAVLHINNERHYRKPGPSNDYERVDQVRIGKKEEVRGQSKLMRKVKEENVFQGDKGLSSPKTNFGNHSKYKYRKAAINQEKEGDDETDFDVKILESADFEETGILSSFVLSKKFHKCMTEEDCQHVCSVSNASNEFREQVLNVLSKPYDKEEYTRLWEAVNKGSYLYYYPDLGKKLKRYRCEQRKCMSILRGFFFWLENLTQEGSFRPWNDRQCLAVETPSV